MLKFENFATNAQREEKTIFAQIMAPTSPGESMHEAA